MSPKYRVVYFNLRGRAEPIRWILSVAEEPFLDDRFDREKEWPAKKKETQYGKVPLLVVEGEKTLSQSVAICRYLGRELGLVAEDAWMAAVGDEVADAVHDLLPHAAKILYAKLAGNHAESQKLAKEFNEDVLKWTLMQLEAKLSGESNWFCGDKMTWPDIFVACYLSQLSHQNEEVFADYPKVKSHFEAVVALPQVQKWVKERPETPL